MNKTNVMRLLDAAKITYRAKEYAYDENDLSGLHAAEGIGEPAEQIFKTLVARGRTEHAQLAYLLRLQGGQETRGNQTVSCPYSHHSG